MNWALLILATWRATHLVTDDTIPFGKLRDWLDLKFPNYGYGLGCTFCQSIWIGGFATIYAWQTDLLGRYDWSVWLTIWFALATTTIVLEGVVSALMAVGEDD